MTPLYHLDGFPSFFCVTESVGSGNLCDVPLDDTSRDNSLAAPGVQLGVQFAYSIFSHHSGQYPTYRELITSALRAGENDNLADLGRTLEASLSTILPPREIET